MVLNILLGMVVGGLGGAALGLIPFFLGRSMGKPVLGGHGLLWSAVAGVSLVLSWTVPAVVAGFVIVIVCRDTGRSAPEPNGASTVRRELGIRCISGPLMGQVYGIGPYGLILGRDHDCTVRFPSDQPGVSRHHCSLRREGGVLMLTDMGSSHGTFLDSGFRLPPQTPIQIPVDARFYLVNTGILFQVVTI